MKHFQTLLEIVNTQGGVYFYDRKKLTAEASAEPSVDDWIIDPALTGDFGLMAKEAQVFVFSPNEDGPAKFDYCSFYQPPPGLLPEIDAPFTTFSIEMSEGAIAKSLNEAEEEKIKYNIFIDCILVHEVRREVTIDGVHEPRVLYWLFLLSRFEKPGEDPYFIVTADVTVDLGVDMEEKPSLIEVGTVRKARVLKAGSVTILPNFAALAIVQKFLNRLNREASGQERVNFRTKLRLGGKKEFVKIRRIIHIAPKKTEKVYAGKLTGERREIEWSHAWFSRGHWRRLEPGHIGKNRTGDYVEFGRTWVTDSVKGPDHLKMIKKTYVVDPE